MKKHKQIIKAELMKRLKAPEQGVPAVPIAVEDERLLHELQVQQIELETQNRELREAQQLVEGSRDRYADLYDFAPVGYLTLDDKGIIREINLTAAGMLGVERTRLVGVPFQQHVAREDLAQFREHLRRLAEERMITELHLVRKDGGAFPVEMQSVLVYDAESKGYLCRTALTDITERRQAERALRDTEARLRAVLDTAVNGIITIDERGIIESFNRAAERIFGYPAGEVIGQNVSLLMPSPHRELHDHYLASHRDTGVRKAIGVVSEQLGRRKDGTVFPLELSLSEVQLAGRRIFTGIARDITQRRKTEEALREERDFVSAVVQTAGALVIVLDEAGRVVRFNRACEQVTGYAAEEMVGKALWDLLLPPEEVAPVQSVFEQLRAGQLPSQFENCWRTKAGRRRLISWSNTVLTKPDGTLKHIIGTGLDITERRRDEVRRRLQYETARVLADAGGPVAAIIPKLLQTLAKALQWDVGEFWEVTDAAQALRVLHVWHAPGEKLAAFVKESLKLSVSMFDGLPGQVLATRQPCWIPDIAQCPQFIRKEAAAKAGLHSALVFPIQINSHVVGLMAFLAHRETEVDEDLLQLFASLGSQIGQFMERKRAEEALREAHEFGNQVIGGAEAGIIVYDREGRFVVWNRFMEQLSGYRAEEVLGRRTLELFPFLQEQKFEEMFARALAGETFETADAPFDVPEKGRRGWKVDRFAPLRDARHEVIGVIVAVRDITERRRLEFELLEISDREQRRIGNDLHDGLGQQLTAIQLMCHSLREDLAAAEPRLEKQAVEISDRLCEAIRQTRALSHGLAPVKLEAAGLMEALGELARATSAAGQVKCRFHCPTPVLMADAVASGHLFRIAQEAVNNALKHGRARKIKIDLSSHGDTARLRVSNDGKGLRKTRKTGMGLEVMKHRARIMGGTLAIESPPGKGVTVDCRLPIKTP